MMTFFLSMHLIFQKYMAIKDHHFQGCYLIDMRTVHMPVDEIIKGIKVLYSNLFISINPFKPNRISHYYQ